MPPVIVGRPDTPDIEFPNTPIYSKEPKKTSGKESEPPIPLRSVMKVPVPPGQPSTDPYWVRIFCKCGGKPRSEPHKSLKPPTTEKLTEPVPVPVEPRYPPYPIEPAKLIKEKRLYFAPDNLEAIPEIIKQKPPVEPI